MSRAVSLYRWIVSAPADQRPDMNDHQGLIDHMAAPLTSKPGAKFNEILVIRH